MDELLGRGEFGFVHRVTHKSSKKTLAVKMRPELTEIKMIEWRYVPLKTANTN